MWCMEMSLLHCNYSANIIDRINAIKMEFANTIDSIAI